jgi:predicted TIM-barrel fold metal-dependent hydrolase
MSASASPLDLFDVNVFAGRRVRGGYRPAVTAADLLGVMDSYGIRRAVAWHIAQHEQSANDGNALIADIVRGQPRLTGCWTILPPQTRELPPPPELFAAMAKAGVRALRLFPDEHRFMPNRLTLGPLFDGVVERRIPVLVSLTHPGMSWGQTYQLLADFPELTCILCDTGVWGQDRYFRPLLERYPRVHVETSLVALGDGVVEALVRDYGASRLVFGSGFPDREPEAAILPLLHADIAEADKAAIGAGNLDRLLRDVELGEVRP